MVAHKAAWVLQLPEGFNAIKIKIGRSKWMHSPAEAEARDIEVTKAVRAAIGPNVRLFVDGNKDYDKRPRGAAEYAEAVRAAKVAFLEQMLPDTDAKGLHELRLILRTANNPVRLAGGESEVGGLPDDVYSQRIPVTGGTEPLIDIEQADMNRNGFLHIREKAARQRALGMTFAPHNFGSKLGFYAQVHLGLVVPNWEASEIDDVSFPALHGEGFEVRNGVAKITGQPGLGVRLDPAALGTPTIDLKA
jgi:D-galactarolactone cycloisomerase